VSGVSGLRAFDEAELLAITQALGVDACVVAPKLALGETLGAGGGMAIAAALGYLRHDVRSHVVRGTLRTAPRTALVTSLGYYGNASALVMRAPSM
jgi:3-oxoacyl-(acyl-carrier-protein) synthase